MILRVIGFPLILIGAFLVYIYASYSNGQDPTWKANMNCLYVGIPILALGLYFSIMGKKVQKQQETQIPQPVSQPQVPNMRPEVRMQPISAKGTGLATIVSVLKTATEKKPIHEKIMNVVHVLNKDQTPPVAKQANDLSGFSDAEVEMMAKEYMRRKDANKKEVVQEDVEQGKPVRII